MMLARALGLADEEEDEYSPEQQDHYPPEEEEDSNNCHNNHHRTGTEDAWVDADYSEYGEEESERRRRRLKSVEELYCRETEDLETAYDRLQMTFDEEQEDRATELREIEARHGRKMASVWKERDAVCERLEAARSSAEKSLKELELRLTANLHERVHSAFSSEMDANRDAISGLDAETERQRVDLEELRAIYGALCEKLERQRQDHAEAVARAANEALTRKKAQGEHALRVFTEDFETKTRNPLMEEIAKIREFLNVDGPSKKAYVDADSARFRADLKASEHFWADELKNAGADAQKRAEKANAAEVAVHSDVVARLSADLEDASEKASEKARELNKLQLEWQRLSRDEKKKDSELADSWRSKLDAFQLQADAEDASTEKNYSDRLGKAVSGAISRAKAENQRDFDNYDRASVLNQLQSQVRAIKKNTTESRKRANDAESRLLGDVEKRKKAHAGEIESARRMMEEMMDEDNCSQGKSKSGITDDPEAHARASRAAQSVLELRRDASALREAVAEIQRTLAKERELHPIRLRFLQSQIRDKEREIDLARTKIVSNTRFQTDDSNDPAVPKELRTSEIYKSWRAASRQQLHEFAASVRSSIHTTPSSAAGSSSEKKKHTDHGIKKKEALEERARLVDRELAAVESELAVATGHRMISLKERRDTLRREANFLSKTDHPEKKLRGNFSKKYAADQKTQDGSARVSRADMARKAAERTKVLDAELAAVGTETDFENEPADCCAKALNEHRFVDLTFPPIDRPSVYPLPKDRGPALHWIRALELFGTCGKPNQGTPAPIFDGGIEPNDIKQGKLGDCWLVCALAAVAEFPELIRACFPPAGQTANSRGLYRVKICAGGQWRDVTVDDYLPCDASTDSPRFSRAHGAELWVVLFEKAMAKVHGGYFRLRAGLSAEGLWDITGLPTFQIPFKHPAFKQLCASGKAFDYLVFADQHRAIACASTPGEDTFTEGGSARAVDGAASKGLIPGHAYSLLSAVRTKRGDKLVRLRNPWGSDMEWNGEWGDDDPRWTEALKREISREIGCAQDEVVVPNDGTFWMSFQDFVDNFQSFSLSVQQSVSGRSWSEYRARGCLTPEDPAELYVLTLEAPGHVYVSLHQSDERSLGAASKYLDLGVTVVRRSTKKNGGYECVDAVPPTIDRQVVCPDLLPTDPNKLVPSNEDTWPAGEYVVCAYTTGTVFSEDDDANKTASSEESLWPRTFDQETCRPVTRGILDRFDSQRTGRLDGADLDAFFDAAGLHPSQKAAIQRPATLLRLGAWLETRPDWRTILQNLGYGPPPEKGGPPAPTFARPVSLCVHADVPCTLRKTTDDDDLIEEAQELPILKQGRKFAYGDVDLYLLATTKGVSILASNLTAAPLDVRVDASRSRNCKSHAGRLDHTVTVPPLEAKIIHHLSRAIRSKAWGFSYTCTSSPA